MQCLLPEMELDTPDTLPRCIGGEVTDEPAFAILWGKELDILVSEKDQPSAPAYRVDEAGDVADLLKRLVEFG